MANINDIRDTGSDTVIDMSRPETVEAAARPMQTTSNVRVRPKTVVNPKPFNPNVNNGAAPQQTTSQQAVRAANKPVPTQGGGRTIADLSSLPSQLPGEEIPVKTPTQAILEGENSPLANYLKEKEEYYAEKDAIDAEEDALNENDAEIEGGVITDNVDDDLGLVDHSYDGDPAEDELETNELDASFGSDSVMNTIVSENTIDVADEDVEDILAEDNTISSVEQDNSIIIDMESPEEEENISASDQNLTTIDKDEDDEEEEKVEETTKKEIEEVPDPTQEAVIAKLKKLASEKIKPVSKKLDLSTFTVVKKPTANTKFLSENPVKVAKWVLPTQGTIVRMKEMTGSELEMIREFNEDSTSVSSMTKKYRCLYDHIASAKPSTFEAWCKSTPLTDLDHYFFGLYIAAFKGANFVPVDCPNKACKETYLTDDVPFMDMVRFETEEDKKKFNKIYQKDELLSNEGGLYTSEIIPLSDRVAIEFRDFSLYSALELAGLDADFRNKHSSILYFVPHIDALYMINQDDRTLTPIGFKVFPDSPSKTAKSRILKYESVLNTLSADEFNIIRSYIASLADHTIKMSYQYPEFTCPKCGEKTKIIPMTAENMVFTRYQLATLVTTVLK